MKNLNENTLNSIEELDNVEELEFTDEDEEILDLIWDMVGELPDDLDEIEIEEDLTEEKI